METPDFSVRPKLTQLNESGQASIEFILTVLFTLATTLLFIALALNTTKGYFAHYANYMASRTYLTFETSNQSESTNLAAARNAARSALDRYKIDDFGIPSDQFKVVDGNNISEVFTGTTLTFSQLLSPLTIIANGANATFHTESFLGKEPLRVQCMKSTCLALTGKSDCTVEDLITIMDNGC